MQVPQISQNQFSQSSSYQSLHFGALRREVLGHINSLSSDVFVSHRNDTSFFRDNDFWKKVVDYISKAFEGKNKLNVYFYGCSNGSEPYTFIMQMFSHQNSALAKKIPFVVAKDYDSEVISMAKTGKLPMQGYEFEKIQKYTGGNFDKFFNRNQCEEFVGKNSIDIPLKKEFFDKIKFSVADVTEDCQNIEGKNSIVFIRNFLPYLKSKQVISKLASDLGEQLKSGSLVAVGNFDKKGLAHHRINLDEILDISGFTQTEVPNLYKKV